MVSKMSSDVLSGNWISLSILTSVTDFCWVDLWRVTSRVKKLMLDCLVLLACF